MESSRSTSRNSSEFELIEENQDPFYNRTQKKPIAEVIEQKSENHEGSSDRQCANVTTDDSHQSTNLEESHVNKIDKDYEKNDDAEEKYEGKENCVKKENAKPLTTDQCKKTIDPVIEKVVENILEKLTFQEKEEMPFSISNGKTYATIETKQLHSMNDSIVALTNRVKELENQVSSVMKQFDIEKQNSRFTRKQPWDKPRNDDHAWAPPTRKTYAQWEKRSYDGPSTSNYKSRRSPSPQYQKKIFTSNSFSPRQDVDSQFRRRSPSPQKYQTRQRSRSFVGNRNSSPYHNRFRKLQENRDNQNYSSPSPRNDNEYNHDCDDSRRLRNLTPPRSTNNYKNDYRGRSPTNRQQSNCNAGYNTETRREMSPNQRSSVSNRSIDSQFSSCRYQSPPNLKRNNGYSDDYNDDFVDPRPLRPRFGGGPGSPADFQRPKIGGGYGGPDNNLYLPSHKLKSAYANPPASEQPGRVVRYIVHPDFVDPYAYHPCHYCDGKHRHDQCPVVQDVQERMQLLEEQRRCTTCLRKRCFNTHNPHPCKYCPEQHHSSLCSTPSVRYVNY